jgi:uncharacterized membrane protein
METKKKIMGVIATAAAIAFITAPLTSTLTQAATTKVKCYGVNSCKGKSTCKTASNSCKSQNTCKGKGFLMKSTKHCKKLGGNTTEPTASS